MKKRLLIIFGIFFMLVSIMILPSINASTLYNSGNNYTLISDVNEPLDVEQIINAIGLQAFDGTTNISGSIVAYDVKDYVEKVLNMPDIRTRKLGDYKLKYRAYDSGGNYSDCVINVSVKDLENPYIDDVESQLEFEFKLSETQNGLRERILNKIVVTDNHDVEIDLSFQENDFFNNITIGVNELTLIAKDKSNNSSSIPLTVTIIDDFGPAFSADNTYISIGPLDSMNQRELMEEFNIQAFDEVDGACAVTFVSGDYFYNTEVPGIYPLTYSSTDSSGNTTEITVYLEVTHANQPVFYIDETKVVVTTKVRFNTSEAVNNIKLRKLNKEENFDCIVLEDEYSKNSNTPGEYKYKVRAIYNDEEYEDFDFIIKVIEEIEKENNSNFNQENKTITSSLKKDERTFGRKFLDFFKNTGLFVYYILKWPVFKITKFFK